MGTRSTYRIIDTYRDLQTKKLKKEEICLVYLQYDGYPEGHPVEVAEWLSTGNVVNGFHGDEEQLTFNGAGCLAAQLVAKLKVKTGNVYLHSLSQRGFLWEEFLYDIIVQNDMSIVFVAYKIGEKKPFYKGSPSQFVQLYKKLQFEEVN